MACVTLRLTHIIHSAGWPNRAVHRAAPGPSPPAQPLGFIKLNATPSGRVYREYRKKPCKTPRISISLSLARSSSSDLRSFLLFRVSCKMPYCKKVPTDKVCDLCGVLGRAKVLAICSRCKKICRHIYCMPIQLHDVPEEWYCEKCLASSQDRHKKQKTTGLSHSDIKNTEIPVKGSAMFNEKGSYRQASKGSNGVSVTGFSSRVHMTRPISRSTSFKLSKAEPPKNSKVKFFPEAALLESGKIIGASTTRKISGPLVSQTRQTGAIDNQTSHGAPNAQEVKSVKVNEGPQKRSIVSNINGSSFRPNAAKRVEAVTNVRSYRRNQSDEEMKRVKGKQVLKESVKEEPVPCSPLANNIEPIKSRYGVDANISHIGEPGHNFGTNKSIVNTMRFDPRLKSTGFQIIDQPSKLFETSDEMHPSEPEANARWRGELEVFDVFPHIYHGIQAHTPGKLCLKAYDAMIQFPEQLKFKLLPRIDAWPRIFKLGPPTVEDVGVYFFQSEDERYKDRYTSLLERIDKGDLAMQSCLEDADLLVYTSKQLAHHSQGVAGTFLWGVFRKVKSRRHGINQSKGKS